MLKYSFFISFPLPYHLFSVFIQLLELDAMTTAKTNTTVNPIITVPMHKGVLRNDRVSEDVTSLSSTNNQKIEVPLHKRGLSNPGYQSTQHVSQEPITAPPVPVRIGTFIRTYVVGDSCQINHLI